MMRTQLSTLLADQIRDPDTQWSLGTFGGIAEFSRDPDEKVTLTTDDDGVLAVTARGAIAISRHDELRPVASESITRQSWSHRVALCLPIGSCAMNRRKVLTELGADRAALREQDRESVLFDLGLEAMQADLCIRVADPDAVAELRRHAGRSVFDPGNPAMGVILATHPHRVFISRIGRIEVYQPIPPADGTSPDGPHTHVLPKLLRSKRTHPATEPVPDGWLPCAHFYPAHPAKDAIGIPHPFDRRRHDAFQRLIATWGLPDSVAIKQQVTRAVLAELPPFSPETTPDRFSRISIRVALRQMQASGHGSPTLSAWLETFDRIDHDPGKDDGSQPSEH